MFARGSGSYLGTAFVAFAAVAALAYVRWAGWVGVLLAVALSVLVLFLVFFRDPERVPGAGVVSPADGRVMFVDEVEDLDLGRSTRIAVFMHVHDVHVNRAPVAGEVEVAMHKPGGHMPAWNKESERNERFTILYDGESHAKTIQIAGTVARRIVPYVKEGDRVEKGQRVGLIRFGSRVDTLVPARSGLVVAVRPGERVKAGVSTLFRAAA